MIGDYRALLKKYMQHVGDCEGVLFLRNRPNKNWPGGDRFTDAEWEELNRIAETLHDE